MSIALARIDNRLIHGQVLEAWVPHIHADCIVVANNPVAKATFQRVLMEAAVPKGIKVLIATVEEAVSFLDSEELSRRRVLLLFANSEDALRAHRLGLELTSVNLGNMHAAEGKVRFTCTIALDQHDIDNLQTLEDEGVRIVSQCIPSDRQQNWHRLVPAGRP